MTACCNVKGLGTPEGYNFLEKRHSQNNNRSRPKNIKVSETGSIGSLSLPGGCLILMLPGVCLCATYKVIFQSTIYLQPMSYGHWL